MRVRTAGAVAWDLGRGAKGLAPLIVRVAIQAARAMARSKQLAARPPGLCPQGCLFRGRVALGDVLKSSP